jgi:hypothetical protein
MIEWAGWRYLAAIRARASWPRRSPQWMDHQSQPAEEREEGDRQDPAQRWMSCDAELSVRIVALARFLVKWHAACWEFGRSAESQAATTCWSVSE